MEIKAIAWQYSAGFRRARHNHTGGVPVDITPHVDFSINNNIITVNGSVIHLPAPHNFDVKYAFLGIKSNTGSSVSADLTTHLPSGVTKVTLVYMPAWTPCPAGGPPSPSIVFVDAFNMDAAEFSDCDEFVQVYDVSNNFNPVLTQSANEDGAVVTASAENLKADNQITDSYGTPKFNSWKIMGGSETSSPSLGLAASDSYIAVAFFKAPSLPHIDICTAGTPHITCLTGGPFLHWNLCYGGTQFMRCDGGIQLPLACRGGIELVPCHGGISLVCPGSRQAIPGCTAAGPGPGEIDNGDIVINPPVIKGKKVTRKPVVKRAPKKK